MFRKKYYYDHSKLQFVRISRSPAVKIRNIILISVLILLSSVFVGVIMSEANLNPQVSELESEQSMLIAKFDSLNHWLNGFDDILSEYQVTDDSIYRCILELEPLPTFMRDAGLGGTNPYGYLEGLGTSDLMISVSERLDRLALRMDVQDLSFRELIKSAADKSSFIIHKPSIQPISLKDYYWISSDFGSRIDPISKVMTVHYGIDFAGSIGLDVHVTGDGTVSLIKISPGGYGKEVLINHGYGYSTRYGHLNNILVYPGQKVKRGTIIGTLGNSGKSTGPHLHYEVMYLNKPVNPIYFFSDDLTASEYEEILAVSNQVDN